MAKRTKSWWLRFSNDVINDDAYDWLHEKDLEAHASVIEEVTKQRLAPHTN